MIASFVTRGLQLVFGYVYPAYECYKTVELNKPDIDQLLFWCQYWILVAGLTVCERIFDTFIGWVPMYGEAKLAFFIYLWFPKTKGTTYVYSSFFKPYIEKHEPEIDRNLSELRTRAGDMAFLYWQKAANYGQTRIFDILQYFASQSTPLRPAQPQQDTRVQRSSGLSSTPTTVDATQVQGRQLSSPSRTSSLSKPPEDTIEVGSSEDSKALVPTAPAVVNELKTKPASSIVESSKTSTSNEDQTTMQVDSPSSPSNAKSQPSPQVMIIDSPVRVTRARSRITRAAAAATK